MGQSLDISTAYCGVSFKNPFVLASGPPTANGKMIARAFKAGWAGAVIKTLIKEPVQNIPNRFAVNKIDQTIIGFENLELLSEISPEQWATDIQTLKKEFPDHVIIGSIMGDATDKKPWVELADLCQSAGADMVELNFSCPHGYPEKGKGAAIGQNPEYAARITQWLKDDLHITIPVIPKLTAAVTDIAFVGESVAKAGAEGISAINTIPGIMGFDLKTLQPLPSIGGYSSPGGYSGKAIKPIALRCICELAKGVSIPIMACGGITSGNDAIEFMLLGAPIVQVCTHVMLNGYEIITDMKEQLLTFMIEHRFKTIDDFLGIGLKRIRSFSELPIETTCQYLVDSSKCIGCGQCETACNDAGYQAISIEDGIASIDSDLCGKCSLCKHVCPEEAVNFL